MTHPARAWSVLVAGLRLLSRTLRGLIAAAVLLTLEAGLPWALCHYIGWPLPDHIPVWAEVEGVLLAPMTTTFLLDVLACLCWIVWAVFTLDVARCTVDAARGGINPTRVADLSATGPMRALAGLLIGAILVAVLGHRPAAASTVGQHIVATASAWPSSTPTGPVPTVQAAAAQPASVVVLAPRNGIHDSLSRIAQRTLGDAARWPEIFDLNKGKAQLSGRFFTNPNLIYPGEELILPGSSAAPAPLPPSAPITVAPAPEPSPIPPAPAAAPAPAPPEAREPSFSWGAGMFVGLGLATAVSTALILARRRYYARYRPGSGDRDDLAVAPVVYQLRLAHLRSERDDEIDLDDDDTADTGRPPRDPPPPALVVGTPGQRTVHAPELGVQDGRAIALDLAAARGLGLVGAGAPAAARALLVAALTTANTGSVLVSADDLPSVLGERSALPAALRVVDDLQAALDTLETEILLRATDASDAEPTSPGWPPLLLVARPPAHHQRLQAVLDNGAPFGITGLLLGQWQPGVTCYVRDDGTISATGPGLGEALRGTRMFHLGEDHTADLLTLLHQTESNPAPGEDNPGAADRITDLEVTAAVAPPTQPDGDLEVLETRDSPSPDAPPHPAATDTAAPIHITMLGALQVHWRPDRDSPGQEITGALQPRTKELLVLLALHPAGTTRETLTSTLWGQDPPTRPTNALHTALSRLRRDLAAATAGAVTGVVSISNDRYQLDPEMVTADYWRFDRAVAARRAATTEKQRIEAYRGIVDSYGGPLVEGISSMEWIEPAREASRRDAIDAVAALARTLVEKDPQQTLDLLEIARAFDPHNETVYRDIMRLQGRLGQFDAIPRTLTLLATRLAEIDETPSEQAIALATQLRQRPQLTDTATQRPSRPPTRERRHAAS
ncbi:transcriptional regulator [Amycolatopsis sp. K13G38]|uniref:Transcriptional regulator n=1 Tax=Amycolatopsis acididurans TaxID=2724524 RepID=A0ABX1JJG4_9PSEU|nr:BTAD domain-containing putative transcriptional regulator [Amycolatopsis acididurans]NKQ59015.1 transcriptional regulator [Amycolatopsis acididurans]